MIKCIIIDDEPMARKGLREYIGEVEFLVMEGEFENPLKASDLLLQKEIQLIFLDIQMPKISGIEFLKSLQNPPLAIFTTAYPEFAVEGFDLNAIDYLLKPFSFERFLKAVMKAKAILSGSNRITTDEFSRQEDYFFIKVDNKLVKIRFDEILFVEALQNYITIHTLQKKYISYLTFHFMEENLPADIFIKVHKSYLVSMPKIQSIEGNELVLGMHKIPVSRGLKDVVMDKLLKGKFYKR